MVLYGKNLLSEYFPPFLEEREIFFRLTCSIAEMNKANKDYDIALRLYKEANSLDPNNSKVSQ